MSEPGGDEAAARPRGPAYALGSSPAELDRLRRQSAELAGHSTMLLDRAGLCPGQAAADLGCGPNGILGLLADRVGPAGRVTGLEIDPASIASPANSRRSTAWRTWKSGKGTRGARACRRVRSTWFTPALC